MCPAASQRQPSETCSMARIFWLSGKKISGYYNYCHLSFCLLFLRLTPYRAFAKKKKKNTPLPFQAASRKPQFGTAPSTFKFSVNKSQSGQMKGGKITDRHLDSFIITIKSSKSLKTTICIIVNKYYIHFRFIFKLFGSFWRSTSV